MRRDAIVRQPLKSSFLSCEKDTQAIVKLLFVDSQPYSNYLKRLLVINEKDCLDTTNTEYSAIVEKMTPRELIEQGYIRLTPRITFDEHESMKSYIVLSFDNFTPNKNNPEFYDCTVEFDILCNIDEWSLKDYQIRPIKIAGYIDGIFNFLRNQRLNMSNSARVLSGLGEYELLACNELILDQHLGGYCLTYRATHGGDDKGEVPTIE